MKLFHIYEGAIEAAGEIEATEEYHGVEFNPKFVQDYASNALSVEITEEQAQKIVDVSERFDNEIVKGTHNFYHMVEKPLDEGIK